MDVPRRRFHRTRKVAGHGGRTVVLSVVFAAAALAGVKLHADTPRFRRLVREIGNHVLAGLFDGKIVAGELTSLSLGRRSSVALATVDIVDPDGGKVIHVEDVRATIELATLLQSIFRGAPDVELSDVALGRAEIVLDVDADGHAKIGNTFASTRKKKEPTPSAPAASGTTGGHVRVVVPTATIAHATVHGDIVPPALDGDLSDVRVALTVANDHCNVVLEDGRVVLRRPRVPTQQYDLTGTARGSLDIALADTTLVGQVDLDGAYGPLPVVAHATLDHGAMTASVDVARTEQLRGSFRGVPITQPVELHARASGTLPVLALSADAAIGAGSIHARGELDVREGYGFRVDAELEHVDAQGLGQGIPTDLSGTVHGEGVLQPTPIGTFKVVTVPGTVDAVVVPATVVEGRFEADRVVATFRATEDGVDAHGKVDVDLPAKLATIDVQARSSSLRGLWRAPNVVGGAASARVQGKIDLATQTIKATVSASGSGLDLGPAHARSLDASGTLSGPLTAPVIDASFRGTEIALKATGKDPLVYREASGRAHVVLVPTPTITNASIDVTHAGGGTLHGTATTVRFGRDGLEAQGVKVEGIGQPVELDVRGGGGLWSVRAKSGGVDLHRLAHLTGIQELRALPEDAHAVLDVDVRQDATGANGHIDVAVKSATGLGSGAIATEAHATIERGKLRGTAKLEVEGFGAVDVTNAELDVPRRLDAASLRRATGSIEWRATVDLSRGAALFAGDSVERVAGMAYLEGRIDRGDPTALPALRATVRTDGLEVVYGDPASQAKSVTIAGIDVLAHVAWDGRTDDTEMALVSWDARGLLVSGGVKSKVPFVELVSGRQDLDERVADTLELDAVATLPDRAIQQLPEPFRPHGVRGQAASEIRIGGTVAHPHMALTTKLTNLREETTRGNSRAVRGVDGILEARWDGEHAAVTFALNERERTPRERAPAAPRDIGPGLPPRAQTTRKPGHVRGLFLLRDLRMVDLLRGRGLGDLPWTADGELELEAVNLAGVPGAAAVGLQGSLDGRLSIRDVHRTGWYDLKAHVADFGASGAKVGTLDLISSGRNGSLFARAKLEEGTGTDTSEAIFQVVSQSPRVEGIHLGWEPTAPTRIDYAVRNARLALLTPLFKSTVSELDGRANGAGSIVVEADSQTFEGGLALAGGRLYVNALGEEITGFEATARFDRAGTWRIDNAYGKIGTGEFKASANGRMKGFSLVSAEASLVADKNVPISSEAATFAEATGEVHLTAKMAEGKKDLLVTVDVPKTNVQLPDRSAQRLQPLDADPTIKVGVRRRGTFDTSVVRKGMGGTGSARAVAASAGKEPLVTQLAVTLGNDVHLEGRGLDVKLGGKTLVDIADEVRVTGQIDLRSGTIEVHGRRFTVDRGTVTFPENGDPANPTVVAAAYWDSPDRTRVWVEFTGPLKTGKLSLRSEPAYSKNEILSVLLFGRPDPNMATGASDQTGDASGATAVGTGFVASDLNLMLSEIDDNLDIETDTLSGNRARTKLGRTFFDRRLKVQIGYAPGRTYREPDTTYLFLNWQFIPQWSLVATRGDRGTSILDILFQHRY